MDVEFKGTERFEIVSRLGSGGMGVVYRAYDHRRGAPVALKTLHRLDPASILRLKQEFRTIAHVAHRNLVTLHELVSEGNLWFFTMDLLDGVSFLDWVRQGLAPAEAPLQGETLDVAHTPTLDAPTIRHTPDLSVFEGMAPGTPATDTLPPPVDVARLRAALSQLVNGIAALHAAGMLHRDIKPSNVMVLRDGRVVLLDFGLVTQVEERRPWQSQSDMGVSGTLEYMAPEQSTDAPPNPASDWYAVGVMLFQALTGRLPFEGSPFKILMDKRRLVAPSPADLVPDLPRDLVDLCTALLRRDPAARPGAAEILGALTAHDDGLETLTAMPALRTLVGRETHLAALGDAWREAQAGRGAAVYVHGSSGMGKSALIRHFLDGLPREALVLAGRCYERESVPYKALDPVIDELTTWLTTLPLEACLPLMPPDVLALARLFPVLRQVGAVEAQPPLPEIPDARELRRRAIEALRELLRRISARHRVVLYVDDLQWGDRDSARLLADVLAEPAAPPMMLLGSYRTEEADSSEFLATFRERHREREGVVASRTLEVGPLAEADARTLAHLLLGRGDGTRAGAAAVAIEAGGNPFFIEALVGYLQLGRGATGAFERLTLAEMVQARVSALTADARRLLTVVCVAARPLGRMVAQGAARIGSGLVNALALLRAQHLLRVRLAGDDELLESFHDRIRETVVAALPPEQRRREHQAVAIALEATGDADVEALAEHFLLADDLRKAATYTVRAAERAAAALAFDHAATLYQQALEIARRRGIGDAAARAEEHRLLVALAAALVDAGRCAEAARTYLEAAAGAAQAEALDLQRRAGEQLLISGHVDEGKKILEGVLLAIDMKLPASPKRALASLLAWRARLRLRGLGFRPVAEAAAPPAALVRIDLTWAVALGLGLVDHIRAADYQARSLYYSLESGEPYRIARSLAMEVAYAASVGRGGRARVERLRAVAERLVPTVAHPHTTGIYQYSLGVSGFSWGEWPVARRHLLEAERVYREQTTGLNWEVASNHLFLLSALGMSGELGEIARRVPPLLDDALARGNVYAATNLRTGYPALTWLARDEPEIGREMIRRAMAEWSKEGFHLQHYFDLVAETNLDLYCGAAAAAWQRVLAFWPGLEASLWHRVEVVRIDTYVYRARCAVAALAAGVDVERARATAARDARTLRGEAAPWAMPNACQTDAALAALAGRRDDARAHLERAETGFEGVGMPVHAAAMRRRRGELLGGTVGAALVETADAAIREKGAVRPEAIVDMLAPGFGAKGS